LQAIQSLCIGMVLVMLVISTGFTMVVWLALDGQALAGQLYTIGGISIVTIITGCITPFVPPIAWWIAKNQVNQRLPLMAKGHPELVEPTLDAQRLSELFALKTYIEYAIPVGVAFAWAITYHIVSDTRILVWIAGLLLFALLRYPTAGKYKTWMTWATAELGRFRTAS
jgi:hypothetical protein